MRSSRCGTSTGRNTPPWCNACRALRSRASSVPPLSDARIVSEAGLAHLYRKLMDALYLVCVAIAGTALVLISAVIPWAVFTRYVLNSAASWPEPTAVLLTIVVTFIGAAACYRRGLHMNVSFFVL